jgi:sugar phosphate permease
MIMWLPFFVTVKVGLAGIEKGTLTSLYDIGGIVGSILCGWLTDRVGSRTVVITPMLMLTVPIFILYRLGNSSDYWIFFILTPICGLLVSGASNLISSTVAADLAQNEEIKNDKEALSTVAGIIDGTGGIGASIGQVIVIYR